MRGFRRLADRAQDQATLGPVQEPTDGCEEDQSEIDERIEAEEKWSQERDVRQKGNAYGVERFHLSASKGGTQEGRHARAEDRQRKPRRALVRKKGERQNSEDQRGCGPRQRPDRNRQQRW